MKSIPMIAVIAACSGGDDAQNPTSFGVGVVTRPYVDATRPTPANGTAPATAQRNLVTEIWYPAPAGTPGPETQDAPLASGEPFPLVVFVHGSMSSRRQSTYLMQGLAAAGYVVMAADFPLTAGSTDGGPSDLHVEDETGDVKFLADQAAGDDLLRTAIDPHAGYAVVGHSTGGAVALLMAFGDAHDDRVRAAVAISADSCFFADGFFRTRSVPLLALTGSRDLLVPPPDNTRRAYELAGAPKVFASLVGGYHMGFTDYDIPDDVLGLDPTTATSDLAVTLAKYGDGSACSPIPAPSSDPNIDFATQHARTLQIVQIYLDRVVRGLDTPLAGDAGLVVEQDP